MILLEERMATPKSMSKHPCDHFLASHLILGQEIKADPNLPEKLANG
jgi:hypothetical protein